MEQCVLVYFFSEVNSELDILKLIDIELAESVSFTEIGTRTRTQMKRICFVICLSSVFVNE